MYNQAGNGSWFATSTAAILKTLWRHIYAADGPIHIEFASPTQNEMLLTIGRLKSKPEVGFQYSGRSFSETGSSYNSAVEW